MANYTLNLISQEDANAAYNSGVKQANRLRERAKAERRIAEHLDGAYITKRLDAKLRELFPDAESVYIDSDSYNPARKYARIRPHGVHSYCDAWSIDLWAGENRRVDGEMIRKEAEGHENDAAQLLESLNQFHEFVGRYNVLATVYGDIHRALNPFFHEMVYPDWSLRRL